VRFVRVAGRLLAIKELPAPLVEREFAILRRLESAGMPAVTPVGAVDRGDGEGFIITDYLRGSIQYRRLLSTPGAATSGQFSGRLLDALAVLLVDLHRHGVWWGDGSLANALLKRDGNRLQAYLVDAETAEYHEQLSDGQRQHDLDILVENVAFGLADAAAALIRDLNALGFAVEELSLDVTSGEGMRVSLAIASRRFHAEQLLRLTGVDALEGQAQLLLNDLHEYGVWLQVQSGERLATGLVAARWRAEVLEPTLVRLRPHLASGRDALQAYCDALEHKWILSERAGADVGLDAAVTDYISLGAPAPESARGGGDGVDTMSAEDALVSAAVTAADEDASR
jgi:tRNA A-37 threonylcarbamoyl transferase component Bud32